MKKTIYILLLLSFATVGKLFSQTITISGNANPSPGSEETYSASFDYNLNSYTTLTWSVSGGTIVYAVTNPTASSIYCIIDWDNSSCYGSVSLYDDMQDISGYESVQVGDIDECPHADAGADITICQGGSGKLGTPAVSGYIYSWSPTTGLSNPNIAQPLASPSQTTTYTLTMSLPNLIQNGDFESGSSNFSSDYGTWPNGDGSNCGAPYGSIAINSDPYNLMSSWCHYTNHTSGGSNMLVADASCIANHRIWYQTVNVAQNHTYVFSGWASANATDLGSSSWMPSLRVRINGTNIIQNFLVPYSNCSGWSNFTATWNSGSSTTALIEIIDDFLSAPGNDFNLDDLSLRCPTTTDNVEVTVGSGVAPTISPSGPITKCVQYETGPWLTLNTNFSSNLQWYENGTAISGENSQSITLTNNPSNGANWPNCSSYITVMNTSSGCTSTPVQVTRKNFYVPDMYISNNPGGIETPSSYCKNTTSFIQQLHGIYSSTVFWWEIRDPNGNPATGITITNNNTTNNYSTISFSNYSYSTAIIEAKASDNGCVGASDGNWLRIYTVTINPNCRTFEITDANKIEVFPNPANTTVTFKASTSIQQVEIYSAFNPTVKKVKVNGMPNISINVADLSPGLYSCKLKTVAGIKYCKLLIERQ
jgi:hypothetical protein